MKTDRVQIAPVPCRVNIGAIVILIVFTQLLLGLIESKFSRVSLFFSKFALRRRWTPISLSAGANGPTDGRTGRTFLAAAAERRS